MRSLISLVLPLTMFSTLAFADNTKQINIPPQNKPSTVAIAVGKPVCITNVAQVISGLQIKQYVPLTRGITLLGTVMETWISNNGETVSFYYNQTGASKDDQSTNKLETDYSKVEMICIMPAFSTNKIVINPDTLQKLYNMWDKLHPRA